MARKGENIFKRKDGRWKARYEKGRDPNSRIIYGYCYACTYREARQRVNVLKASVIEGRHTEKRGQSEHFGAYCNRWLQEKTACVKQSTLVKYNSVVQNHIKPALGDYRLSAINSDACCKFKDKLARAGHSPKMVRDILTVLRAILKFVHKNDPSFHYEMDFPMPKEQRKEMRVLSPEEELKFIRFLSDDMDACKFGILIAIMTGMRIGEICALKWGAISFADATVKVSSTMQRLKKKEVAEQLTKRIQEAVPEFVESAAQDIARTVETSKKEKEKESIESSVRDHLRGFSRTISSFLMAYGDENTTLVFFVQHDG